MGNVLIDRFSLLGGALLASFAGLAGCAAGPEMALETAPSDAWEVRRYAVVAEASDPSVLAAVEQALVTQGAVEGEDGLRLQAALAVRPVTVGAFSDSTASEGVWVESPRIAGARRGRNLHVLTVVLAQADVPNRTVRVSARDDEEVTPPALLVQLADRAAQALLEGQSEPVQP